MFAFLLGYAYGCGLLFICAPGNHLLGRTVLSVFLFVITAIGFGAVMRRLSKKPTEKANLPSPLKEMKSISNLKKGVEIRTSSLLTTLVLISAIMFTSGICFAFANSYADQIYHHRFGPSQPLQAVPLGDKADADDLVVYDLAFRPTRIEFRDGNDVQSVVSLKYEAMSVTALFDNLLERERLVVRRAQTASGYEDDWRYLDGKTYQHLRYNKDGQLVEQQVYDEYGVLNSVYMFEYLKDGTRSNRCLSPEEYDSLSDGSTDERTQ